MVSSGATAGLSLLSAATWGGSDFAGGWGARRASSLLITASGQVVSLAALLCICLALRLPVPATKYLVYAGIGGFEGAFALAIFYRALAMGAMGLTAALTGLLTALVPVVFDLLHAGWPGMFTTAGLALGLSAIWMISQSQGASGSGTPARALLLGACAGTGFGAQLILFKMGAEGGVLWALTSGRIAGAVAILLTVAIARPKGGWSGFWLAGIISGSLDAVGNLFYMLASQKGRLDVAAVICSMYPAGTIVLAGLILRERPTRKQLAGMGLALAAVALLSA
ncbi:DMT family transporter [Occallatibacter savannae]|uniref:DMT family transporter n=1 Tax=Occallatibacter savannae TaxID=1002691 RepID=UPI000D68FD72|nr:DMT family transporter [Occallatibacter savannae]